MENRYRKDRKHHRKRKDCKDCEKSDEISRGNDWKDDTVIKQCDIPFVIRKPGKYVLGENVCWKDKCTPAITIKCTENVCLDLKCHTIDLKRKAIRGILVKKSKNVSIQNGSIVNARPILQDVDIPQNPPFVQPFITNVQTAGIRIKDSENVSMTELTIDNCLYGIASTGILSNIFIEKCNVTDFGAPAPPPPGTTEEPFHVGIGIFISGKDAENPALDSIVKNSNIVSDKGRSACAFKFNNGTVFDNNIVRSVSVILGIGVRGVGPLIFAACCNAIARDSEIFQGGHPVFISNHSEFCVIDNCVAATGPHSAFEILDSEHCAIRRCTIIYDRNSGLLDHPFGFLIAFANDNVIEDCYAEGFNESSEPLILPGTGIFIGAGSTGNIIRNNVLNNCTHGILITDFVPVPVTNNQIVGNQVSNCDVGFTVLSPAVNVDNTFYNNLATGNVVNFDPAANIPFVISAVAQFPNAYSAFANVED